MTEEVRTNLLGILGGLGPLASAEFLKTIYECSIGASEQSAPAVVMHCDPAFPDRTQAFLRGDDDIVLARLIAALEQLCEMGASKIVICCVTMHHLLPRLPPHLSARVRSLLDVIFEAVGRNRKKHLLICSNGTRRLEIFQRHEQWKSLRKYFVLPEARDQNAIHEVIYSLKQNQNPNEVMPFLESLLAKYEVTSFIAGCTEIHLLTKHLTHPGCVCQHALCVDPLIIIGQTLAHEYHGLLRRAAVSSSSVNHR
jgi:aspartate racemase